jgi:hypothetical protein
MQVRNPLLYLEGLLKSRRVPQMKCPHCGGKISKSDILSWAASLHSLSRTVFRGALPMSKECPYCHKAGMSSRELAAHLMSECKKRPRDTRGRKPVLKTCRYCRIQMPTVVWLAHEPTCPERYN